MSSRFVVPSVARSPGERGRERILDIGRTRHNRRVRIAIDDPRRDDVRGLLDEHLADMRATSPAESVHALDHSALADPAITLWTAREDDLLLGCGALKVLSASEGEVKSMRTAAGARGRGVASAVLSVIVATARERGWTAVSLETGSQDSFAAARRLYARHGFVECGPFAAYRPDPNSVFMRLELASGDAP
jgi:putative acetyltransferase